MKNNSSSGFMKILIVILFILVGGVSSRNYQLNQELTLAKQDAEEQVRLLQNEIDFQKSVERPVVLAREKLVAFPDLGIALPYNGITKTIQYIQDDKNIRVTSTHVSDYHERQMSCSELVRLNFESGSVYNPWEESVGEVKLADGRTLYIIASKAFANNEASTEECAEQVWGTITPQQVAEEFKKAQAL